MTVNDEAIRKGKRYVDEANWRIRKIQEDTGDTETATLVTMNADSYSWMNPVFADIAVKVEFRYGDEEGHRWLNEYELVLKRAYSYWKEGAERYKALISRVDKLGLRLDVNLKGATLYSTQEFIDSREAYRVDKLQKYFNFSELAYENFVDLLEYLEWKNEIYCTAEGEKRRLALAEQIVLFESWEQLYVRSS